MLRKQEKLCGRKDVIQGTRALPWQRRRRRPRTCWEDNVWKWTALDAAGTVCCAQLKTEENGRESPTKRPTLRSETAAGNARQISKQPEYMLVWRNLLKLSCKCARILHTFIDFGINSQYAPDTSHQHIRSVPVFITIYTQCH